MAMLITPPIFIRADELYVFRSKEEAESLMEPVDMEPDERGYDSEGRLLHVVVRGEVKYGRVGGIDQRGARVELVLAEEIPHHREEFRALLAKWLAVADAVEEGLAAATLEELVERAAQVSGPRTVLDPNRLRWLIIGVLAAVIAGWRWLTR